MLKIIYHRHAYKLGNINMLTNGFIMKAIRMHIVCESRIKNAVTCSI
jgi:hypothetical protein